MAISETEQIKNIKSFALQVRKNILEMAVSAGAGSAHFGGALSITEIVSTLFAYQMKIDKKNPNWELRDRFILSKGHACLAYYAALHKIGQISADENGRAVGEKLEIQTRNVFDFIHNTLHEAGADERDVVKINSYFGTTKDNDHNKNISEVVSEIFHEYYPNSQPVYTGIGVTGFAFEDLLIEIEAIAIRSN